MTTTTPFKATQARNSCDKQTAQPELCSRCKTAGSCTKERQRAHCAVHKNDRVPVIIPGDTKNSPSTSRRDDTKPFHAIRDNIFLRDRPEEETFNLLIDCLRMHQEDVYVFDRCNLQGSIYHPAYRTSEGAFRTYIAKAKGVQGLLPPWWTDEKLEECVRYSLRQDPSFMFSLAHAVDKHDVQKLWGDDKMPMKLRMIGEKVYGRSPGGGSSEGMMKLQLAVEDGTSPFSCFSMLDVAVAARC